MISLRFEDFKIIQIYYNYRNRIEYYINKINTISDLSDKLSVKHVLTRKIVYEKNEEMDTYFKNKYDYTRYKTLQLISNEIYDNEIKGDIAEVAVYRGDFVALINICFKDRKLFLFDTFQGFNECEKQHDLQKKFVKEKFFNNGGFKDTIVDIVLSKMKYKDNCIIKKGYFPDTAVNIGVDKKFAFVSIDLDLSLLIYNALEFFYPRLSQGGYIFIHDYNTDALLGVRNAIKNFGKKYGRIMKIPISDYTGTSIIGK